MMDQEEGFHLGKKQGMVIILEVKFPDLDSTILLKTKVKEFHLEFDIH
jgi:hypothetical protein